MDGVKTPARRVPLKSAETVTLSYHETARHLAPGILGIFEEQGMRCLVDEKLRDPGERPGDVIVRHLGESSLLCILISRRCAQSGWQDAEVAFAISQNLPVLVFLEDQQSAWQGAATPTLITAHDLNIRNLVSRARPDSATLWEFGKQFFVDRSTAALFQRAASGGWRWNREVVSATQSGGWSPAFEICMVDESVATKPEVCSVQAAVEHDAPVLWLGTTDRKRYRLAYSAAMRAVLPAPVLAGAPVIGFMHMDFDSGKERPRAGEASIEMRLLGREVCGWHMSEYFWRAFVGSLPKVLGRSAS